MIDLKITEEQQMCKALELSGLVEIDAFVIRRRSYLISEYLLDEKGVFLTEKALDLQKNLSLPVGSLFEKIHQAHIKNVLNLLAHDPTKTVRFRQLSLPLANQYVESLIRWTLLKKETELLEKKDLATALLASVLTLLRQNVGSCFAAAPIMHMQLENPLFLLEDLYHLMTKGFLKRVLDGEEIQSPMSIKTGKFDLLQKVSSYAQKDPILQKILPSGFSIKAGESLFSLLQKREQSEFFKGYSQSLLLKCYEFTAASFADWKVDFYKWNLYKTLGLDPKNLEGIGGLLFQKLKEDLDQENEKIMGFQEEMQEDENRIRTLERLFEQSSSMDQLKRYKREMQSAVYHMHTLESMQSNSVKRAEYLSQLFKNIINSLLDLFPQYFQEVFDPDMVDDKIIDADSMAGFRLLYKFGRQEPSLWKMVENEKDYIFVLETFFKDIELSLIDRVVGNKLEERTHLENLINDILEKIREPDFVQQAYKRTEDPKKTPWSYSAGGSLEHFMQSFCETNRDFSKKVFYPEDPLDFCCQLIEFMKDIPWKSAKSFIDVFYKSFLMSNKVHAFRLLPGLPIFKKAWESRQNTYTFVRDNWIEPALSWYKKNGITEPLPAMVPLQSLLDQKMPEPIVFADSNWANDLLGFVVNPKTENFNLYRVKRNTMVPLVSWDKFFQKTKQETNAWTVYTNPAEYQNDLFSAKTRF